MKRRIFFGTLAVLVTAFILCNSMQTAPKSDAESKIFVDIINFIFVNFGVKIPYDALVTPVRKAAHITEFFVQSFCIANAFGGKYSRRIVYILFLGLLTACTDEFTQLFVMGRSGEVRDIFIDFSGTILGMAIGALIYGLKRRKKCRI